jgi:hypothetical protein
MTPGANFANGTAGVDNIGGKFSLVSTILVANLLLMSTAPVANNWNNIRLTP